MTLTRFVLPSLMLGLVLSFLPSVATAGVVYGNLGNSGNFPTAPGADQIGVNTSSRWAAAGFKIGAPASYTTLKLNSVTLALSQSVAAGNVELWSSAGATAADNPVGFLADAIAVNNSLGGNLYTFKFNNDPQDGYQLTAGNAYWVVIKGETGLAWETQTPASSPIGRNGSTYAEIADYVRFTSDNAGSWSTPSVRNGGFSITAVPEPSTYALAGIGAGLLGLAKFRRRLGRPEIQG